MDSLGLSTRMIASAGAQLNVESGVDFGFLHRYTQRPKDAEYTGV